MSSAAIAFTAPHWAATEAGLSILRQGGSATEAMVAAAAAIAVVYPHMNSLGGDGFWLIHNQGDDSPLAIDACGRSASKLDDIYSQPALPARGGSACLTQAATVAGWQLALAQDQYAKLPLAKLLLPAIELAEQGFIVTPSLAHAIHKIFAESGAPSPAFRTLYAPGGQPLQAGQRCHNPALAQTLKILAREGLEDFYQGEVARQIVASLAACGSPLSARDHQSTVATRVAPLQLRLQEQRLFNLPAPTAGIHSLQILGILERLKDKAHSAADWAHLTIEATKQAFADRAQILADPESVPPAYGRALDQAYLQAKAMAIDPAQAQPWPLEGEPGDTVWMGARDANGQLVSFIQSLYWEFGSGQLIDQAGFAWNNRGISFAMQRDDINCLAPNKKPRHTLNPALAIFDDGSRLSYGSMGGDGQPQTQAVLFSRFVWQGYSLAEAISTGRWLLGRTWGDHNNELKLEADIAAEIGDALTQRGHRWRRVSAQNEMMGHAGAIYDGASGLLAATDPRSDGRAESQPFMERAEDDDR